MAWVNFSVFFGGAALVGVPILLHLIMRQKPKPLVFPALRFVKERRDQNQRTLELRHWLLLLLRCLALLVLGALLARPSVASAQLGDWLIFGGVATAMLAAGFLAAVSLAQSREPWLTWTFAGLTLALLLASAVMIFRIRGGQAAAPLGDAEAPVAAAILIDTAPRMGYELENQTRLEAAKSLVEDWLLGELPANSEIAMLSSRRGGARFARDRGSAIAALDALEVNNLSQPLPTIIPRALKLLEDSELPRKELYLFTDLAAAAWESDRAREIATALADNKQIAVYVIDVGAEQPSNTAIRDLRLLSGEVLGPGGDLQLEVDLSQTGASDPNTLELFVEAYDDEKPYINDGRLVVPDTGPPKSRKPVRLRDADAATWTLPRISGFEPGTHHGYVRLARRDNLPVDDIRYFTFEVRPPLPILLVPGPAAEPGFLQAALAPEDLVELGQARFAPRVVPQAAWTKQTLEAYAAVCFLDPAGMTDPDWARLERYVREGGRVAFFLGRNAFPVDTFNGDIAQRLLPGTLAKQPQRTQGRAIYPDLRGKRHPIVNRFYQSPSGVPWYNYPIAYHWRFAGELDGDAEPVFFFTNGEPAIVVQTIEDGLVLTMTTPVSDRSDNRPWNNLPTSLEAWPFVMLANESLRHLAYSDASPLNYPAGGRPRLEQRPGDPAEYNLFKPEAVAAVSLAAVDGQIIAAPPERIGAFRLKGQGKVLKGFSVNLLPDASRLERIEPTALDRVLGEGRYQLARDRAQIERRLGEGRHGREFFPYLAVALALLLGIEGFMANRFYRPTE